MKVVKVISTSFNEIGQLLTKLLKSGRSDVQDIITASIPGVDSLPVKDDVALYEVTDVNGENFVIGFLIKDRKAKPGEVRLFSRNEQGVEQIYAWLKDNGEIHFGGDTGNLTRYQELETAFDQLKSDFNTLVNAYNTHIHGTPSGSSTTPSVTASPSTADITGAKIDELKTL